MIPAPAPGMSVTSRLLPRHCRVCEQCSGPTLLLDNSSGTHASCSRPGTSRHGERRPLMHSAGWGATQRERSDRPHPITRRDACHSAPGQRPSARRRTSSPSCAAGWVSAGRFFPGYSVPPNGPSPPGRRASPSVSRRCAARELERLMRRLATVVDAEQIPIWWQTPYRAFGGLKPMEVVDRGESDRLWR